MRADVLNRLRALEGVRRDEGAFLLEDGTRWICADPLGWAMLHAGEPAPSGVAVVGFDRPKGPCDELSAGIYELIEKLIERRGKRGDTT